MAPSGTFVNGFSVNKSQIKYKHANIENIHFFNKDYNFIMLNTNDFFVEKIKQYKN